MMKLDSAEADLLFTALGNKTRRRILQRLTKKPVRSISELAKEFNISNTAASNQVKILEQVKLIERIKRGKYHWLNICSQRISLLAEELTCWLE